MLTFTASVRHKRCRYVTGRPYVAGDTSVYYVTWPTVHNVLENMQGNCVITLAGVFVFHNTLRQRTKGETFKVTSYFMFCITLCFTSCVLEKEPKYFIIIFSCNWIKKNFSSFVHYFMWSMKDRKRKTLFPAQNGLVSTLKVLRLVEISFYVKLHLVTISLPPPSPKPPL